MEGWEVVRLSFLSVLFFSLQKKRKEKKEKKRKEKKRKVPSFFVSQLEQIAVNRRVKEGKTNKLKYYFLKMGSVSLYRYSTVSVL